MGIMPKNVKENIHVYTAQKNMKRKFVIKKIYNVSTVLISTKRARKKPKETHNMQPITGTYVSHIKIIST